MEFQYSSLVDPSTYQTNGLCDGVPLRANNFPIKEYTGAIRAQKDWIRLVGPLSRFRGGGLAAKYSCLETGIPECIPERLEIIAYANEIAFLHDDALDEVSQEESNRENDSMLDFFRKGFETGSIGSKKSGKEEILSKIVREMVSIDRERALTAIKAWAAFLELASGRQHAKKFETLEDYYSYRVLDVGEMFWFGLITFGMAITIPEQDIVLCRHLTRSAYIAFTLQNDIYSYEKELNLSKRKGRETIVNAVWLLTQQRSIGVDEAKEICKRETRKYVAEYLDVVKEARESTTLSLDLKRFLEAILLTMSGNVVYSLTCPRYHPQITLNEIQLSMMRDGVEVELNVDNDEGQLCGQTAIKLGGRPATTLGLA